MAVGEDDQSCKTPSPPSPILKSRGPPTRSSAPARHLASETNKVIAVWRCFEPSDLEFRPYPKSSSVADIVKHQLLFGAPLLWRVCRPPEPGLPPQFFRRRLNSIPVSTAWLNSHVPAYSSSPDKPRNGGWRKCRSSGPRDSASGSSGDAYCTPVITAPSLRSISGC